MDFNPNLGSTYTPAYLSKMADLLETLGVGDCHSSIYERRAVFAGDLRATAAAPLTPSRVAALTTLRLHIYKTMPS